MLAFAAPKRWAPRRKWVELGSAIALVMLVAGCGGSGGGGGTAGGSLLVVDTVPLDGGELPLNLPTDSSRSHEVRILFSKAPDGSTVLDSAAIGGLHANIRIIDRAQQRVRGVAFLGGRDASGRTAKELDPSIDPAWAAEIDADEPHVLRFIHDTDGRLSTPEALPAEQYSIRVTENVQTRTGRPILEPYCGAFTTGPDVYPPVVMLTDPVDGAVDVSTDSAIIVEFNESVVPESLMGNPPTTPSALAVTAMATGGPGGNPSLAITGTLTPLISNGCRFSFQPDTPLPGSGGGSQVIVTVMIQGGMVSDNAANVMLNPETSSFTMGQGPTIANNPVPPNVVWFGTTSPASVGAIAVNSIGLGGTPTLYVDSNGDGITGPEDDNQLLQASINDQVGVPSDLLIGGFITAGCGIDLVPSPNPPAPLVLGSSQTSFASVCNMVTVPAPNSVNADIGTYVYVVDSTDNRIRVLNSNTSLEIDSIPVSDPAGLAISPDSRTLAVSNIGARSISIIDVHNNANTLVKEVNVNPGDPALAVGSRPDAIAFQPDGEDVLVLNTGDDSMSVLSVANGYEVRKVVSSNVGPDPYDLGVTWRQSLGGSGTYFAYISNRGGDSISVYESGPTFPIMQGPDDIRTVLEDSTSFHIRRPMGVHTDLSTGISGEGAWFVNNEDGTVGQLVLTFIGPPPNPYFPNPAPTRVWGMNRLISSLGEGAKDVVIGDSVLPCAVMPPVSNLRNNYGQLDQPFRGYVAVEGGIAVFDARNGLDLGVTIPVGGVSKLATYFSQ